jgi:DNA repair protein RadC
MKKMKEVPVMDRPREKIATKGASVLSDNELIEAIIGRGTRKNDVREISKEIVKLLKHHNHNLRYDDILEINGIGPTKASQVLACLELGRRYFKPAGTIIKVTSPEDVLPLVAYLKEKRQEYFICLTLNGAGEILSNRVITVGLLNHSLVHPREVFAEAIADRAASIICVHNHPSGSLEPSSQDLAITVQLRDAGILVGIQLIDHIIVSKNGYLSMRERGIL